MVEVGDTVWIHNCHLWVRASLIVSVGIVIWRWRGIVILWAIEEGSSTFFILTVSLLTTTTLPEKQVYSAQYPREQPYDGNGIEHGLDRES